MQMRFGYQVQCTTYVRLPKNLLQLIYDPVSPIIMPIAAHKPPVLITNPITVPLGNIPIPYVTFACIVPTDENEHQLSKDHILSKAPTIRSRYQHTSYSIGEDTTVMVYSPGSQFVDITL